MRRLVCPGVIMVGIAFGCASNLLAQEKFPQQVVERAARAFPDAIFYKKTNEKVVALTIDDVPMPDEPGDSSTRLLLKTIAQHNDQIDDPNLRAHATFFVISGHLHDDSTIISRIIEEDHEIGNHGEAENTAAFLSPDEFELKLRKADARISEFAAQPLRWFRPGRGLYNQSMLEALRRMPGYEPRFALASMLPIDISMPTGTPGFTAWYARQHIFPGSILVFHGHAPDVAQRTSQALEQVLADLHSRGYRVVTLSDLWDHY